MFNIILKKKAHKFIDKLPTSDKKKRVCEEKSVNVIFYDNDWAEGSQMSIQPLLYI